MPKPVVSLVTGASRGIGLAIAHELVRRDQRVITMSRTRPSGLDCEFIAADLADAGATTDALAEVTGRYHVSRLVNNAGIGRHRGIEQATLDDYHATFEVHVRAAFQCMQAVLPGMREARFGRIVNIGSRAQQGKEGRAVYGAAKAAIHGMTRTVALEYARYGVTVNCIAPGPVETELLRNSYPEGSPARDAFLAGMPMRRFGRPEEIAAACGYFLSDEAGFTTGQILYVCGGMSIGLANG
jgi:NAD(P)-dependent dehydrogenase (short-subunit alcohol dehydrogenase family)